MHKEGSGVSDQLSHYFRPYRVPFAVLRTEDMEMGNKALAHKEF